ncbi:MULTISPECIES: Gfo/Idh/MocA family protein [unclassified Nesterenkonia]|uniref:Gfo/Idh/MocA family protein n=1 Tax=unclassified Nesterenkonia TaxID=2629769 RepID=UPI001F4CF75C|nr:MULTISPECIES: Gfo/Idh/MocA family oxidoreductase [unclassified Nesterenkonia]MCH8560305.1 Gfo/Idh/MocA family oxidoreductase [Nesterenkonia sp. DZ6]MCH8563687.1 Gfo/Idh/MocA family oxidoreductase [Nesterenkonia sp. YGD6]
MTTQDLRVAVVGTGLMGTDHVQRLTRHTIGAHVSAVVDIDAERARAAAEVADQALTFTSVESLISADAADAVVLATPGFLHEEALFKLLEARIPVMCEKPLTPDPASSLRVVEAEVEIGKRLIQVGFMRRFDAGYRHLKEIIDAGTYGELLMLHHQHRNATVPATFSEEMLIHDSVVHEFDAVRFFSGEEIANVGVRRGRRSKHGSDLLSDPQLVTMQTTSGLLADVEIFVNAQLGYQVLTQAVFEEGVVKIGESAQSTVVSAASSGSAIDRTFHTRFVDAYDTEIQQWVDSVLTQTPTGPSAWDGYATAAVCGAGVEAQQNGGLSDVTMAAKPDLYS